MSPQTFSRSLLAQLVLWTAIVGGSLAMMIHEANTMVKHIARLQGNDVFRIVQSMRQWNAKHGGILVEQNAQTPPNPYLQLPERDPVTVSGRRLTTLNPAYMTRQLAEEIRADNGIAIHITSLKPVNPENGPDAWEGEALRAFETGLVKERSEFVEQGGHTMARYMAPLATNEACLQCHRQQGYKVGDVRGGISVSLSAAPLLGAMRQQVNAYVVIHLAVWLSVAAALLFFAIDRQRKAEELERSNKRLAEDEKMAALGSMVAGVAHEVNTPLGVCITAASMVEGAQQRITQQLADTTLSQESLQAELRGIGEAASILEQNLQRAAKLIRSFKQIAVDQNTTETRAVDIKHFLDEIITAYHNPLKKAGVEVRIECPENLVVTTDAGAFVQIITNLLQNTMIHAVSPGERGRVRITVRDQGDKIEVVFADDGKGMEAGIAKHAFDPFVTTKRGQGGSGLGLNIVYNLVTQRFKGDISLNSAPGRGATFTLHLTKDQ